MKFSNNVYKFSLKEDSMTTLVGIRADKITPESKNKGIVLASDLSRTQDRWNVQGDQAYRQQTRSEGQKIYTDDKGELALCMSGVVDQQYIDFLSEVLRGRIDFRAAIKDSYLSELFNLNLKRWGGMVPNNENLNSLLVATRFDNSPKLYTCYPLGKVEERSWTSIGSGSGYALNHIQKKGNLIPEYLSLHEGVDLAVSALEEAAQDLYTGGADLTVITPTEIKQYGETIKARVSEAQKQAVAEIKKQL